MHNSLNFCGIRFGNRMISLSISCAKPLMIPENLHGNNCMTDPSIMMPHHWAPLKPLSSFTTSQANANHGITEDIMVLVPVLRSTIITVSKLLIPRQKHHMPAVNSKQQLLAIDHLHRLLHIWRDNNTTTYPEPHDIPTLTPSDFTRPPQYSPI